VFAQATLENSVRQLRTDYIDVFLARDPPFGADVDIERLIWRDVCQRGRHEVLALRVGSSSQRKSGSTPHFSSTPVTAGAILTPNQRIIKVEAIEVPCYR
jgi:hypothetical protein